MTLIYQVNFKVPKLALLFTKVRFNVPKLKQDCLENFKDQNEFSYVSKNSDDSQKGKNTRNEDKWWVPTPQVPPNGLSEVTRKWLQFQKDSVNQVHKASMAINAQILSEMEIPEDYIESLPKVLNYIENITISRHELALLIFFCIFLTVEWEGKPWRLDI